MANTDFTNYFHGWSDHDFAVWLAGYFDGEGCMYLPPGPGMTLSIASTHPDVIESIYKRMGLGTVAEIVFDQPRWKTKYEWRVRRWRDIRKILVMMRPWLTIKTVKVDATIRRIAILAARTGALEDRNEQIVALRSEGLPHAEIAERFGITRARVTSILSEKAKGPRQLKSRSLERQHLIKPPVKARTKTRVVRKGT